MRTSSADRIAHLTSLGHWGEETLHSLLERQALLRPDHLAVIDPSNKKELTGDESLALTWSQLNNASDALASRLQSRGFGAGDRFVVQLPNIVELVVMYYALSKLGAIISPVPIQYGSLELKKVANTLDAKALVTIEQFQAVTLAKNAGSALPDIDLFVFGKDLMVELDAQRAFTPDANVEAKIDANDIITVCWTSGTTGTPKGVPRSHNMWLATARACIEACDLDQNDRMLCPFPLVNMAAIGGMLLPVLIQGCTLTLHHPFDVTVLLSQIQQQKITFTVVPPALLNSLAKSRETWGQFDLSSLRAVGSGSAPLSPWMIETFATDYGIDVINMYGSNEGITLYATPENAPDAVARATQFYFNDRKSTLRTRVADPITGKAITSVGQQGELLVDGATVIDGYLVANDDDRHDSAKVFSNDGFFRTGDLVEICGADGQYYRIVGRCKDIINRGGMKISPVEIDLLLEGYPHVVDAAVCAYPDERLSEKICACLVLREDTDSIDLAELQQWLLEKGLAKFKLPERIELFDRLPRNPLGKVQRFLLADEVIGR